MRIEKALVETTGYVLKKIINKRKAKLFYKLSPVLTGGICNKNKKGFSQIVCILAKAFKLYIFSHPAKAGRN